jgi:hypothetical protein
VSTRIAVLEQLTRASAADEGATAALRARAVEIASADAAPVVRARAVQLHRPSAETAAEFCETALADEATIVRQFAAARTVELLGPASAFLLLDCLAKEQDPATFATLHEALKKLGRTAPQLPAGGGETAEGRQQIVDGWRHNGRADPRRGWGRLTSARTPHWRCAKPAFARCASTTSARATGRRCSGATASKWT